MATYSIAFVTSSNKRPLRHKIVEGENREAALRSFFTENVSDDYSDDEKGFLYFKEDFFEDGVGSVIEL